LPTLGNSDIAVLNRRMRSRMYGGVGGVSSTLPAQFFQFIFKLSPADSREK
jgi:hypothetical protein